MQSVIQNLRALLLIVLVPEKVPEESIEKALMNVFLFQTRLISSVQLDLLRPIYRETTHYGHFGKSDLPWEQTNKTDALKNSIS
jgi:S-adenosylmethionine synthetase